MTHYGVLQFLNDMAPTHPMNRVGELQEVARAITWLASDLASFTTGAILPIDGGRYATTWSPVRTTDAKK